MSTGLFDQNAKVDESNLCVIQFKKHYTEIRWENEARGYNEVIWRKSRSSHHILLCSQLDIFSMSDWYLDPACECHPNQPERIKNSHKQSYLFKSDVLRPKLLLF